MSSKHEYLKGLKWLGKWHSGFSYNVEDIVDLDLYSANPRIRKKIIEQLANSAISRFSDNERKTTYRIIRMPDLVDILVIYNPNSEENRYSSKVHLIRTTKGILKYQALGPIDDRIKKSAKKDDINNKNLKKLDFFIRKEDDHYIGRFSPEIRGIHIKMVEKGYLIDLPSHNLMQKFNGAILDEFKVDLPELSLVQPLTLPKTPIFIKKPLKDILSATQSLEEISEDRKLVFNSRLEALTRLEKLLCSTECLCGECNIMSPAIIKK